MNIFPTIIRTNNSTNTIIAFKENINEKCTELFNFPNGSKIENNSIIIPFVGNNIYNGTIKIVKSNNKYHFHNVKIY